MICEVGGQLEEWCTGVYGTCHPLHEEVVVALLAGGAQHADDVGVVEVGHHADLLAQRLHHLLLLRGGVAHVRHLQNPQREDLAACSVVSRKLLGYLSECSKWTLHHRLIYEISVVYTHHRH